MGSHHLVKYDVQGAHEGVGLGDSPSSLHSGGSLRRSCLFGAQQANTSEAKDQKDSNRSLKHESDL